MKELKKGVITDKGNEPELQNGWIIKVYYDEEDTKGYYIFYNDPTSDLGFDAWFPDEEGAFYNLNKWKIKIEWD